MVMSKKGMEGRRYKMWWCQKRGWWVGDIRCCGVKKGDGTGGVRALVKYELCEKVVEV